MTSPLTPIDCDLRDSKYMPMFVQQMLNSSFNAMADDTAWRAGVTLWMRAWLQVPAASLPDDNEELCQFAGLGRDMKTWRKTREKALRGWTQCDDGRLYHPLAAEAALEAWIGMLLSRISSGAGNAKKWGSDFDGSDIERQIGEAYPLLKALNPRADGVKKIDRRNAIGKKQQSRNDPDVVPLGYSPGVPPGSQPKPEPKPEVSKNDVVDDAGATTGVQNPMVVDALGWPSPMIAVVDALSEITTSDPRRAPWQSDRRSIDQYLIWQKAGVPWQTVIDVIVELSAKKRDGPPATMAYFTAAILQAHADRTAPVTIPEARPHERRSPNFQSAGERNQDSTIAAFRHVFADLPAGEDEHFEPDGGT